MTFLIRTKIEIGHKNKHGMMYEGGKNDGFVFFPPAIINGFSIKAKIKVATSLAAL